MAEEPIDDGRHAFAPVEEWVFAAWTGDARLGLLSGHRIVGRRAWYWAALVRAGRPLLHVADFDITVRADPFVVKGEALWAEHHRLEAMRQWSVGNETYAVELDDPDDALGRGYGHRRAVAFDFEWYSTANAELNPGTDSAMTAYAQDGVAHGTVEVLGEPTIELAEVPARRWHRWSLDVGATALPPVDLPPVVAHTGLRAPFAFPDGSVLDAVLTPAGWAARTVVQAGGSGIEPSSIPS